MYGLRRDRIHALGMARIVADDADLVRKGGPETLEILTKGLGHLCTASIEEGIEGVKDGLELPVVQVLGCRYRDCLSPRQGSVAQFQCHAFGGATDHHRRGFVQPRGEALHRLNHVCLRNRIQFGNCR